MAGDKFAWLDQTNAVLSSLTGWLDGVFADISRYGQEGVDEICRYAGDVISYKLNCKKADVLNALHEQYLGQLAIIAVLKPIVEFSLTPDPGAIVEFLELLVKPYVGPYAAAVKFVTELAPKVIELSSNMQKLASYQPTITAPDINLDKFQIKFTPFTLNDVIAGEVPYPDPPQPFQPPKPRSSEEELTFSVMNSTTMDDVKVTEVTIDGVSVSFKQDGKSVTIKVKKLGKFSLTVKGKGVATHEADYSYMTLQGRLIAMNPA